MDTLFINACVREHSRTRVLADALLERLPGDCVEVRLAEAGLQPLTEQTLEKRDACIRRGDYSDPMFNQAGLLKEAKQLVIAAPYWDLSFPALLKIYTENILVSGLTFRYSEEGFPVSLCRAERLFFVSTAGGPVFGGNGGYDYIRQIGEAFLGIREFHLIQAENLDIDGNNPDAIIAGKLAQIHAMVL